MDKINILVVPSDNIGAVGFYRSIQPHLELEKMYPDEFSVTFDMNPDWGDLEGFKKYNIVHVQKGLFSEIGKFWIAIDYFKQNGIISIIDIDDHWKLTPHQPQYHTYVDNKLDKYIKGSLKIADYVTTTTDIFAEEISKINKNVYVLPNAIDPDDSRFKVSKKKSDRLRIGFIMGSSHEYDMNILGNFVNKLPKDVIDKVQFVLCGFDMRGKVREINRKTGEVSERDFRPKETVWYRYEKQVTDNYKIVSPEYKAILELYTQIDYPNADNEAYKRYWTKDINHYYEHYNNVDVLLAPLEVSDFNKVKSQLKVVECAFSKTALIASDFGPYKIDLKNAIEKGGVINKDGNALLVDEGKNHKDWSKYIEKLVKNPELVKQLQDNLYNTCKDKYNLKTVTKERANIYKEMVRKVSQTS